MKRLTLRLSKELLFSSCFQWFSSLSPGRVPWGWSHFSSRGLLLILLLFLGVLHIAEYEVLPWYAVLSVCVRSSTGRAHLIFVYASSSCPSFAHREIHETPWSFRDRDGNGGSALVASPSWWASHQMLSLSFVYSDSQASGTRVVAGCFSMRWRSPQSVLLRWSRFDSGWSCQGRLPDFLLVSGLKRGMSGAVLKGLVSHPETVHLAVYTVIAIGSVIGFTVVCVIA